MSDELSKQILNELKKNNEKLDNLYEPKGLSIPLKNIALFIGFMVIGPMVLLLLSRLFH